MCCRVRVLQGKRGRDHYLWPCCAGYPFDKGNQMWFSECAHQHLSPTEGSAFPYACSTQPGNSGGPIWVNQDGRRLFVGIHTGSDGLQTNYGTRYSSEVHAFVVNAMATL